MTDSTARKSRSLSTPPSKSRLALLLSKGDFEQVTALTGIQFQTAGQLQRIAEFYAAQPARSDAKCRKTT